MEARWNFSQHFSIRASTMLILYVPILIFLNLLKEHIPEAISDYSSQFVAKSGSSLPWLLLCAFILSLTFLVASVFKRNPQIQFAIELLIPIGFVTLFILHG